MALAALKAAGVAVALNYGVHVGSSFAFNHFCTPHTLWDIPTSFATTASPVCSFLLTLMQTTQNNFAVGITTTIVAIASGVLKTA
jgi:hypothetical protein